MSELKSERIKRETLKHYARMLKYAVSQEEIFHNATVWDLDVKLEEAIGESFYGDYCPLCVSTRKETSGRTSHCNKCPIGIAGYRACSCSPWEMVDEARSWKSLVEALKAEIHFLKKVITDYTILDKE